MIRRIPRSLVFNLKTRIRKFDDFYFPFFIFYIRLIICYFAIFRHGVSRSPHRRPRTCSNGTWRWTRSHYYLLIKKKIWQLLNTKKKNRQMATSLLRKNKIRAVIKLHKQRKETKLAEFKNQL